MWLYLGPALEAPLQLEVEQRETLLQELQTAKPAPEQPKLGEDGSWREFVQAFKQFQEW